MKVMHEDDAREKTLVDNDEIRPEKAMKNTLIFVDQIFVGEDDSQEPMNLPLNFFSFGQQPDAFNSVASRFCTPYI